MCDTSVKGSCIVHIKLLPEIPDIINIHLEHCIKCHSSLPRTLNRSAESSFLKQFDAHQLFKEICKRNGFNAFGREFVVILRLIMPLESDTKLQECQRR